jgi:hypothetical protein
VDTDLRELEGTQEYLWVLRCFRRAVVIEE